MKRIDRSSKVRTKFHQAKWDEPIIYELSTPGERGILVGAPEEEVAKEVKGTAAIPEGMKRSTKLNLPEMSQSRVLRHYARLAQQTLGADVNIEIGQGTCTVKYSPKVNEQLSALIRDYHHYRIRPLYRVCWRFSTIQISICARFPEWITSPSSQAAVPRVS